MRAVTFQAPGEVRVDERPEPALLAADDAVVRVEATGVCGSDLHIYHGRVQIEPGFTLGHEFVGTVVAAGDAVTEVAEGDRVLGCFCTACGNCFFCRRGEYHKCDEGRVFGHGETLGSLQGSQAEQVLVPRANLTLRRVPEGMSDDAALFAGDVMGTGYHAVQHAGLQAGDTAAVLGLGPVGLCAVQAARASGAAKVIAIDSVGDRLKMAESFGAQPVHLAEDDPRKAVKAATEGRGVDVAIDAVGHPDALDMAARLTRKAGTVNAVGVYAERTEVHMGVVWIKALSLRTGHANVIGHVDRVLAMMAAGVLDPGPLVTHHMDLARRGGGLRGLRPQGGAEDRDVAVSDERVAAAIRVQLEDWRKKLATGAERVGWKIGLNIPEVQERLGLREPVIGHLTSATRVESEYRGAARTTSARSRRSRSRSGATCPATPTRRPRARPSPATAPRSSSWTPAGRPPTSRGSWPATSSTAASCSAPRGRRCRPRRRGRRDRGRRGARPRRRAGRLRGGGDAGGPPPGSGGRAAVRGRPDHRPAR